MDPAAIAALAASASALLAPYLAKAGEALAEKVGETLPENVGKLWDAVRARFKGKPAAEEAANDLAARPDDKKRQAAFEVQMEKALAADPEFAAQVEALLRAAVPGSAQASGGGLAAASGGIVSVGDDNINITGGVQGDVKR
jgi:hypothetical protein